MEDEEYDFEYESEEEEDSDVVTENLYYGAKALKADSPKEAISMFLKVIAEEVPIGEYSFKARKQLIKTCLKLEEYDKLVGFYKDLLNSQSSVTKNYSEKGINNMLDLFSLDLPQVYFSRCLKLTLENTINERLVFEVNMKLAKMYFDFHQFQEMKAILKDLYDFCEKDGQLDSRKGTQLLEVYALEIQMHSITKDNKKLRQLYNKCLKVKSGISHPRIMGIIRECGGKMFMRQNDWSNAMFDFFEAFKNYDESGSPARIQCLKYLVLANMLSLSEINPFESPETKPYSNDPEIISMTLLVEAYQNNDLEKFESILKDHPETFNDSFLSDYVFELRNNIQIQFLVELVRAYHTIDFSYLAECMNLTQHEIEDLVFQAVMQEKIVGRIDQLNSLLILGQTSNAQWDALNQWARAVESLIDKQASSF